MIDEACFQFFFLVRARWDLMAAVVSSLHALVCTVSLSFMCVQGGGLNGSSYCGFAPSSVHGLSFPENQALRETVTLLLLDCYKSTTAYLYLW